MPDDAGRRRGVARWAWEKSRLLLLSGGSRENWAPGRSAPCTTSGVSRMKGRRQWGASACVAPFALAPVSCKVRKRSWNASHSASSRRPGRVNSAISRPPAPCDVSDSMRVASGLPPRVGEPGEVPCSRRTSRSSPSSGTSSPSDEGSVSPIAGRGARVHLATACAPNRDSTGSRFIQKCKTRSSHEGGNLTRHVEGKSSALSRGSGIGERAVISRVASGDVPNRRRTIDEPLHGRIRAAACGPRRSRADPRARFRGTPHSRDPLSRRHDA